MNLAQMLKDTAERHPGREAIIFYDKRIHYSELYGDAARFAAALVGMGISPGDRVAIALPNVPEFAVVYFAALCAGAEVVAVNPLYTANEIGFVFEDADVKLAVTHPLFADAVKAACAKNATRLIYSNDMGDPAKTDIRKIMDGSQQAMDPVRVDPRDTAMIVYTNAYRGKPMGACLTHGGLRFDADMGRKAADITEEDTLLTVLPLYHAFSLTSCLNLTTLTGAKSVFHETFNEARVVKDLIEEDVTLFPVVPAIMKKMLDEFGSKGTDLSAVKGFIPGGAPPMGTLLEDFAEAFNANVYQGYGITECGPVTSVNPVAKRINKPGSVGPPLENISVKVVGEDNAELPIGEEGELLVSGENVMEKYLNQPAETEKFLVDGWFHTGDLARLDEDGFIYLTGRLKRMVIVGGFNVYPPEVELELSSHEAIRSCRVLGAPDENLGEKVVAEITLQPGGEFNRVAVQKFLRKRLAPYKIPRAFDVIEAP